MKINFASKTIEITKTFANKASRFGSEEYRTLRTAIHDLPDFQVVVKTAKSPRRTYMKGLTYEFMEQYIPCLMSTHCFREPVRTSPLSQFAAVRSRAIPTRTPTRD